jgi:hypothetical protein
MDLPTDFENLYSLDEEASNTHAESVTDALIYSLNRFARVDIEYISQITGIDLKDVILSLKGAIYQNPETWDECFYKGWETADQYLSGSLREKLRIASEANLKYKGYFADNIKAIEAIMPSSLSSKEMASSGHAGRQSPKPSQKSSLRSFALLFTIPIAPSWHASAQSPHPVHFSSSILIIFRSINPPVYFYSPVHV